MTGTDGDAAGYYIIGEGVKMPDRAVIGQETVIVGKIEDAVGVLPDVPVLVAGMVI